MIIDFYNSVLPPEGLGYRVGTAFTAGLKAPPRQAFLDTNKDLIDASVKISGAGVNFYHACATFKDKSRRLAINVVAVKSLWVDLDVGPSKPYPTARAAAASYEAFRVAVGLPESWMVASGGGVHVYQPFSKPIGPDQWDRLAEMFSACMDHFGVEYDTSRARDKASILRVPGTLNFKTTPPKPVEIKRRGVEVPARDLWVKLKAYADANSVIVSDAPRTKGKVKETNDLIGAPPEYPPSDGVRVAARCAVISAVETTGGDVSYDVWWRAMGVAKHVQDPEAVAIHWTRDRSKNHDKADALATIAAWSAGPTTCIEFSRHSDKCSSCAHNGKIKSPIQLGTTDALPVKTITLRTQLAEGEEGESTVEIEVPMVPNSWGFKKEKIIQDRCKGTHTGFNDAGQMTRVIREESDDGQPNFKHVPFCDRFWQVTRRIRDIDSTWKLEITYDTYPDRPPSKFLFDSASVLVPDSIKKEFSAREIHIYGGKTAIEKASNLMMFDQELLRGYQHESVTYPTMGWVTQDNSPTGPITGQFILGDTIFSKNKLPTEVLLSDAVNSKFAGAFQTSGSSGEWVRLVDEIYNRPGAEPYQFIIAAMFASPLVKITPGGGEWHGIPIGVGGDSGAAKTTTALVAASMYTNAQSLKFNASPQQGDTINALAIKVGALRNIPCIIDELTNSDPERVSSILFMMANGQPKDRATQHATLVNNPYRWDMTSIISSNDNLHNLLESANSRDAQNASKLRLFQINLRKIELSSVFHDVSRTKVEHELLGTHYGMVGRDWIQFIVNNLVKIQNLLSAARATYTSPRDEGTETRFYRDLILVTYIAAKLAKQRGFIKWDIDAMKTWAESNLTRLRLGIGFNGWESDISDFVAGLNGRTIVTKTYREGRGRRFNEPSMAQLSTNHEPVARKALDDARFFVAESYVKSWCKERKIVHKQMLEEMAVRGYIKIDSTGSAAVSRLNIGSGTDISRPRTPCVEFIYDEIAGVENESEARDNVVAFPAPAVEPFDPVEPEKNTPEGTTSSGA